MAVTLSQLAKDVSIVPSFKFILHVHQQANCCSETFLLEILWANTVLTHWDICHHLWLLLLSKLRILRSQKHQLLGLYRVSPLWRQGFKRENQKYISSQVKSALRKFSEGKYHDCDSFRAAESEVSSSDSNSDSGPTPTFSCISYLKWLFFSDKFINPTCTFSEYGNLF